ncbi:sensor histidine kinase [Modestobacter marinus]|uniref:Anti-sigma regulatory factor n=1 Tax=Modestobacter marinus TaxID=477641 RepID=A0A846LVS7_9ACTN|nr:ATP-binding protein [Modestobacter marinus]NIH69815.1 anti-sigma regulatory factor (Ser/Thr protein kinase) [Modestobacter marinus]GGL81377.1 anti-sigma regulatory factor [Modestobacter marinus]
MTQSDEELHPSPHQRVEEQGYRHVGHVLHPDQDLTVVVGPLLRQALAAGEPVVIACPEQVASLLVAALDGAGEVHLAPDQRSDERPPAVLAAIADLIDEQAPGDGHRLHLVTGPGGPDGDPAVSVQIEALLNHVLAERPVDQLCLLGPATEEGPDVEAAARATHPWLLTAEGVVRSPDFRAPEELLREVQRAMVPDPLEETEPTLAITDLDDMRALRRALNRVLADSALSADAAQDFVLAIDEVTANANEHGVPPVDVRLWCTPERLLCAITDRGTAFDDPLVGYGPAHGDMSVGGMGLWLARRSVDSLTATPADDSGDGCTVRLVVNAG